MSDPIVLGFPRSTFVQIVRLVLTHKDVSYSFRDLEPEMGKPTHLALHPFSVCRMGTRSSTRAGSVGSSK